VFTDKDGPVAGGRVVGLAKEKNLRIREIGDRSPFLNWLSFALCLLDHLFSDRGGNGKQGANKRFHG
jgi:hypothetical protein